jgi:hypothetical protein
MHSSVLRQLLRLRNRSHLLSLQCACPLAGPLRLAPLLMRYIDRQAAAHRAEAHQLSDTNNVTFLLSGRPGSSCIAPKRIAGYFPALRLRYSMEMPIKLAGYGYGQGALDAFAADFAQQGRLRSSRPESMAEKKMSVTTHDKQASKGWAWVDRVTPNLLTSLAPVANSLAPAASSPAPAASSPAPAANSPAPAVNSPAPAANSPAPAANSPAPAVNSPAPAASSLAPAVNSLAPAANSPAPAASSPAPAASSLAPVANGLSQVVRTPVPVSKGHTLGLSE